MQHEALINQAFNGRDGTVICPYDATRLPADVLRDAEVTHPRLRSSGQADKPSPGFSPDIIWARYNEPLPGSPTAATYSINRLADLAGARSFAAKYARWFGMSGQDIAGLQLIVNELATNSLQHARGPRALYLWAADGQLVCQVRDSGRLEDPMAGRRPINRNVAHGRGLFVVNATADLVRIHATASGTTVQAHLRITEPA
ncbi:anti-sigma factor RsbA family regulatory protein [Mycolicibacter sp. MYC017]|uniref:Anti-sigma factor RsbA family regulatory protein n=1 Tax=[Mycobacterium] vasticus TaxID=2875777 RepID=A0ABU5YXX1_9MYCO|nr:anti-sigma factor RsbA family regulatory protein [Mycolicibacter sp. MYC017]MEB3069981.1 anti-sigma factor RsbA family regulatory protein [Mycolicibacter sp. MYC017]